MTNKLRKIEIFDTGILFYFEDSVAPFVPEEFDPSSPTRQYLFDIQHAIEKELPPQQENLF